MVAQQFTVHFSVTVPNYLHDYEYVFVTGSDSQLGLWDPKLALRLEKNEEGYWVNSVTLTSVNTLNFRYFLGYYLESDATKPPSLIISKFEAHLRPRFVIPTVESRDGVCRLRVNNIFGTYGERVRVADGWILNDEQNSIILTVTGEALKFYKQRNDHPAYRIKIVPLDLRNRNDSFMIDDNADDDGAAADELDSPIFPSYSPTEIAPLTHSNPRYRDQTDFGETFHNGKDYFLFRTQSVAVEYLGFRIEVYVDSKPGNNQSKLVEPRLLATAFALPSTLQDTYGKTSVPLTKRGLPIGKINFGYLFVRSLRKPHPLQKMDISYVKHWKKRSRAFEVGHRGMGNSYTKFAATRENTIHSLNGAAKNGADFVEFDVHLTKDKIPIIFHDFHVLVNVAKRSPTMNGNQFLDSNEISKGSSNSSHVLAVKDLKQQQLRLLHLDHVRHQAEINNDGIIRVTPQNDEEATMTPFPTLEEAFRLVSPDVGFNIEVKYPMLQLDGEHECENYFERNEFVDFILSDVLTHAEDRRIVFSSFDPDICTMISLKQNKYPVLFLCVGANTKHVPFVDERTWTSLKAVHFVAGTGLLGVNFHSEDLLVDPSPVIEAKQFGLVTFVWGDELCDMKHVDYFKKGLLVEGLIYDRIGENESRNNVFMLEKGAKKALFSKKSSSPPILQKRYYSLDKLNLFSSVDWPMLKENEKQRRRTRSI